VHIELKESVSFSMFRESFEHDLEKGLPKIRAGQGYGLGLWLVRIIGLGLVWLGI